MEEFQNIFDEAKYKNHRVNDSLKKKCIGVLGKLYSGINKIYKKVQKNFKDNGDIIKESVNNMDKDSKIMKEIKKKLAGEDSFFDNRIKKHIIENVNYKLSCIYMLEKNKKIQISFYLMEDMSNSKYDAFINSIEKYFYIMITWLIIGSLSSHKSCGSKNTMIVDIYLTPFDKYFPKNEVEEINPYNVNSGYTVRCGGTHGITIFRKEEWFKVFLHETMHYFGFDTQLDNNNIKKQITDHFMLKDKVNQYEAYCEFWSRVMNSLFKSFMVIKDSEGTINDMIKMCIELLEYERAFSSFQCYKFLNRCNINYDVEANADINNKLYRENTNSFAYYIITNILMDNWMKYINYCDTHNSDVLFYHTKNNNKFYEYIYNNYNNNTLLNNLTVSADTLNKCNNNNIVGEYSTRMSIVDIEG